jgi:tRNA(fMet)-specific endonuclease VapC
MLKYMLDTNICIYTIKEKPARVRDRFIQHQGQLSISVITLMELYYGAEKSSAPETNLAVVAGFASRLEVLNFTPQAAMHTGQVRAELARQGTPIGPYDAEIAGHARSHGLILVTANIGEFARVEGIRIENWAE